MSTFSSYEPVIGLECHVELRTHSKMFCSCDADHFGKTPNTQCCPVCLGLPGAMPTINKTAVEWCIQLGLALNCEINRSSNFDRKNYCYPDLPKGFQISQKDLPFCKNGWIDISLPNDEVRRVRIHRIHLEEDTAKLLHVQSEDSNTSQIDFNRSGVPLIEIVTEPDIHSALEAKLYLSKLRDIARYLGISTTDMEKGAMRMEPNISLRKTGETTLPPYKTEVKNINSFRFVEKAINFELDRQAKILDSGSIPTQETRGWDMNKNVTYSQRLKENAGDYRYFPEPDLPPLKFSEKEISDLQQALPTSYDDQIAKWQSAFALAPKTSELLVKNYKVAAALQNIFENASQYSLTPNQIASTLINRRVVTWIIDESIWDKTEEQIQQESTKVLQAIQALHSFETVDTAAITEIVREVVNNPANEQAVKSYQSGKVQAIGVLIGQVMKKLQQKVDPKIVHQMVAEQMKP